MFIDTHTHVFTDTHTHTRVYRHTHTHVFTDTHTRVYRHTHTHVFTDTHIHTCLQTHTHTHTCLDVCCYVRYVLIVLHFSVGVTLTNNSVCNLVQWHVMMMMMMMMSCEPKLVYLSCMTDEIKAKSCLCTALLLTRNAHRIFKFSVEFRTESSVFLVAGFKSWGASSPICVGSTTKNSVYYTVQSTTTMFYLLVQ